MKGQYTRSLSSVPASVCNDCGGFHSPSVACSTHQLTQIRMLLVEIEGRLARIEASDRAAHVYDTCPQMPGGE